MTAHATARIGMLADLAVLDFTHHVAGPFCTRMLADLGATVWKVERPDGGDPARRAGPFPNDAPHPERSGLFLDLNTGKQSLTLNLKSDAGRKIALRLAEQADLVVESFAPRVLPSLGLGYEALSARNPRLVLTSISNFGQTGPLRDAPATELTLQAMGARFADMGIRPRPPLRMAPHSAEYMAGASAATASLAALAAADGEGSRHVDVSILEALLASAGRMYQLYSFSGISMPRNAAARPLQMLQCKDGYVAFGLGLGWDRTVRMLERPDLADESRFRSLSGRMQHAEELGALLADWALDRTKREVFIAARSARVTASPVNTVADLMEDPQYRHRGFFQRIDHPEAGEQMYPGVPFQSSEPGAVPPRRRAPLLGEHTEAILSKRLGMTAVDFAALRAKGAI